MLEHKAVIITCVYSDNFTTSFCTCIYTQHKYLHVLQDSKCYLTHPTVKVQYNSQIADIPLTEIQRLKDDHLSTSLRFFNLPLGIGPNDRGPPFQVVIQATMYLPVPGIEPTSSVFLGECVTH